MVKKSNKYIFVLKNIDTEKIERKYDIKTIQNVTNEIKNEIEHNNINNINNTNNTNNITKISELNTDRSSDIVCFLDESKKQHKCNISMIDYKTNMQLKSNNYHCFWDRNPFETVPIGCPIRYVSNIAVKKYISEISKDMYIIKENITKNKKNIENKNLSVTNTPFYETDGVFCSFNCAMAYILDNKKSNRLYDNSEMLLIKMYNDIMLSDDKITENVFSIDPAPNWRLLKEYGGSLSIEEFRNNFNKIEYENFGYVKNFPTFNSIGVLFEKKIKF
jgi:hypothetical protein